MKEIKILMVVLLLLPFLSFTSPKVKGEEGIKFFHGTFAEALQKAKEEHKIIFLDAYASWCMPCKMMAKRTFTKEKVGTFYNKNFINLKIDMEKGEGVELSRKLGVTAYPSLFFINEKGVIIAKSVGYHTASALLDIGNQVIALKK